ncbi:hypothetical protein FKW77_004291 [Venturia effusa]|uniref:Uncharacterized protein n=1 Tax=Venturia effusa TaxID=50376 RepID=A0A517LNR6_9PEZI|nr:hypothetical protein FKW77_004291 [Venturia effusa]
MATMNNHPSVPGYIPPSHTADPAPSVYSTFPEHVPPSSLECAPQQQQQYTSDPKFTGGKGGAGADEPEVVADKASKRKKHIWFVAAVVALIIIVIIVGAVCGILIPKHNRESANITSTPTLTNSTSSISSTVSSAAPTPIIVEILLCVDINYYNCADVDLQLGQCLNMPSNLTNTISSLDTGGISCIFYT